MNAISTLSKAFNVAFLPLERSISRRIGEIGINKYPPVFIIGAPRSGTTLLYKVLIEKFNLSYISNLSARFYAIPIISTWLFKKLTNLSYKRGYEFEYGFIPGLASPSEFGGFWYQWFPREKTIYVAPQQTPIHYLKQLRLAIGGLSYINGGSVIFKNVYNSMRIAPICEAMPNACFIVCKRDYIETALSILNARKQNMRDHRKWWSVPPQEIDNLLKLDYAGQIAGQIYYTYKQINTDMNGYGKDKFLEIKYEEFCQDVSTTIEIIKNFLEKNGITIEDKGDIPKTFEIRKTKGSSNKERKKIFSAIDSYFSANSKLNEQQRKI
ncbi:MAG: sulfotransferase [Desulfobacterales bacterium]|nr:MAG: sulfotransferase [Desulfobacterales bacterium]